MKRIGVLFGQERTFPLALVDRINRPAWRGSQAEPVKVGGVALETPRQYDLILDRISQDIPFYRAILKKFVADGTIVVNNPFWWSADDKFFNNVLARAIGVAVPKTVILPSNQHPPDTTSESMSNLIFPLEWDEIFSHIGFPAYFKPYSGGGWKSVYRVTNPDEFFAAYTDSGQNVMTLQEEIVFEEYFRCYAIGRKYVHIMRYDPRQPHHDRYVKNPPPIEPGALRARARRLPEADGGARLRLRHARVRGARRRSLRDRLPESRARRGSGLRRRGELPVGARARGAMAHRAGAAGRSSPSPATTGRSSSRAGGEAPKAPLARPAPAGGGAARPRPRAGA